MVAVIEFTRRLRARQTVLNSALAAGSKRSRDCLGPRASRPQM